MELERLEALLDTWAGRTVMVRVPLQNTVQLAFYGTLTCQMDSEQEPQFVLTRSDTPSPGLVFYIKDVAMIRDANTEKPQILLKFPVDSRQPFE